MHFHGISQDLHCDGNCFDYFLFSFLDLLNTPLLVFYFHFHFDDPALATMFSFLLDLFPNSATYSERVLIPGSAVLCDHATPPGLDLDLTMI